MLDMLDNLLDMLDIKPQSFMFQNFCPPTGRRFTNRYKEM
jgi:hypothetical protein